jgi:hypothetical protein
VPLSSLRVNQQERLDSNVMTWLSLFPRGRWGAHVWSPAFSGKRLVSQQCLGMHRNCGTGPPDGGTPNLGSHYGACLANRKTQIVGRVLEDTNHLHTLQTCFTGGFDRAVDMAKVQCLVLIMRPLFGQLQVMPGLGAAQNNSHKWLTGRQLLAAARFSPIKFF